VPVGRAQTRFPVLSALPVAYWVTGDTGQKQTTEINWANKYLNIEEIAVIVPVPDNVIDDADEPIWDQVRPLCEQAAGRLLDATVFFGTSAPASVPDERRRRGHVGGEHGDGGTANAATGGIVTDLGNVLSAVEADGYDPRGGVAAARCAGSSARRATRRATGTARSTSRRTRSRSTASRTRSRCAASGRPVRARAGDPVRPVGVRRRRPPGRDLEAPRRRP
jgi:hypothetical protein